MSSAAFAHQLAALRGVVFEAVERWNTAHPQALDSHREHGSVNVTQLYADATGCPTYSITINCPLSGMSRLTFHGRDPAAVAEQARLTVERKIAAQLKRREDEAYESELNRKFGIAV